MISLASTSRRSCPQRQGVTIKEEITTFHLCNLSICKACFIEMATLQQRSKDIAEELNMSLIIECSIGMTTLTIWRQTRYQFAPDAKQYRRIPRDTSPASFCPGKPGFTFTDPPTAPSPSGNPEEHDELKSRPCLKCTCVQSQRIHMQFPYTVTTVKDSSGGSTCHR